MQQFCANANADEQDHGSQFHFQAETLHLEGRRLTSDRADADRLLKVRTELCCNGSMSLNANECQLRIQMFSWVCERSRQLLEVMMASDHSSDQPTYAMAVGCTSSQHHANLESITFPNHAAASCTKKIKPAGQNTSQADHSIKIVTICCSQRGCPEPLSHFIEAHSMSGFYQLH